MQELPRVLALQKKIGIEAAVSKSIPP